MIEHPTKYRNEYIVAWGYDVETGTWAQGHYMGSLDTALNGFNNYRFGNTLTRALEGMMSKINLSLEIIEDEHGSFIDDDETIANLKNYLEEIQEEIDTYHDEIEGE